MMPRLWPDRNPLRHTAGGAPREGEVYAPGGARPPWRTPRRRPAGGWSSTWYHHDPARFDGFRRRYTAGLNEPGPREALARIRVLAADRPVTLLTATRDLDLSQAAVLAALLRKTT